MVACEEEKDAEISYVFQYLEDEGVGYEQSHAFRIVAHPYFFHDLSVGEYHGISGGYRIFLLVEHVASPAFCAYGYDKAVHSPWFIQLRDSLHVLEHQEVVAY